MTTIGSYTLLKTLGSGAFSKVYLAEHSETQEKCAIKIHVNKNKTKSFAKLVKNEIYLTSNLNHPNIIKWHDYSVKQKYTSSSGKQSEVWFMALELAKGGELFDYIFQTGRFSEKIARFYFLQLLDSLEYIHSKGVSHWDIKLQNILLDEKYNLKLADFGFSSKTATNSTFKGSGEYMAPEIHLEQGYHGPAVDLFAAGVLLFIMVTENWPFIKATSSDDYYKAIIANRVDLFWKVHLKKLKSKNIELSKELIILLTYMLSYDPIERASLAEIRQQEWCQEPAATNEEVIDEFTRRFEIIENEAK